MIQRHELQGVPPAKIVQFLQAVSPKHLCALLVDLIPEWGKLGAKPFMFNLLRELTGL